ncbi:MAG: NapC/NirT family cytochrome c [Actinobacteria bacterium]|nr:NapC/NirT family cytochrome c [Actinomycetota bacterium]
MRMVIGGVAWLWGVILVVVMSLGLATSIALFRIGRSADDREGPRGLKNLLVLLKKQRDLSPEKQRSVRLQRLGLWGAVAIVFLVFFAAAFTATSTPQFCVMCHPMKADVDGWQASPHAQVTCFGCHLKPGLLNFVKGHIVDAVKSGSAWAMGSYELGKINIESELSVELSPESCKGCHTLKLKNNITTPSVIINHKTHTDRGINCTTCHNRVGHANMNGYVNAVSMEGCTRCHGFSKTDTAPGKCELCHPKGFNLIPKDHTAKNWTIHQHSVEAKTILNKAKPVSEKKEKAEGGKEAESKPPAPLHNGKASCYQCHDEAKFCIGCHKIPMPHPSNFTNASVHGKLGTEKPQVCANCHTRQGTVQNFCTACHHKGFDPNVAWAGVKGTPQAHPGVAKKSGAEGCLKCHDERYCSSCHTQGQPNMQFMYKQR